MFKPSETASELFRRVQPEESFDIKPGSGPTEKITFGDNVELQTTDGSCTELVLSTALQFAAQFAGGWIVHISVGMG